MYYFIIKGYTYIGCYLASDTNAVIVFAETLTLTQCEYAAANLSMQCDSSSDPYFSFGSHTSMTVEGCLYICSTLYGFSYAGIATTSGSPPSNCVCGNKIKNPTSTSTTCTIGCTGNNAQSCGDSTGSYFSVYNLSKEMKIFFYFNEYK